MKIDSVSVPIAPHQQPAIFKGKYGAKDLYLKDEPPVVHPQPVSFKGKYEVRDLYLKDKLPGVKYDIYGLPLSKKTVSREHIIPRSLGGLSDNSNIALADKFINSSRGNEPLRAYTTLENVANYLLQFVGIEIKEGKVVKFSGAEYIKKLIPSLRHEGFSEIKQIK